MSQLKFAILVSFILFISCKEKKPSDIEDKVVEKESIKGLSSDEKTSSYLLNTKIDVQKIKSQLDEVTTTFLTNDDVALFLDRNKNNFYGYYTLIKNNSKLQMERVGNMVIYDSINPYAYEKDTEEFVEITLSKPGIELYDGKVKIGMGLNELIDLMGDDFNKKRDVIVYTSDNKSAFFKIEDSLLVKLKIGIYRDNVDINTLIENSNW